MLVKILLLGRAGSEPPVYAQQEVSEDRGEDHLTTAHHAPPATVGGETGVLDGGEVGSIGHPWEGVVVLHEGQDMRGHSLTVSAAAAAGSGTTGGVCGG